MPTCKLFRLISEAIVYSPRTSATARKDADIRAVRMFGVMTDQNTRGQDAPSPRAASDSVRTSMADSPASIERYAYGSTSTVYARNSQTLLGPKKYVTHAYTGASPTTRTMAGMVSGSRQRNSMGRRSAGTRSRTHVIVGTSSSSTVSTTSAADTRTPSTKLG